MNKNPIRIMYGKVLNRVLPPKGRKGLTPLQISIAKDNYFKNGGKVTKLKPCSAQFPINVDGAFGTSQAVGFEIEVEQIGNITSPEDI